MQFTFVDRNTDRSARLGNHKVEIGKLMWNPLRNRIIVLHRNDQFLTACAVKRMVGINTCGKKRILSVENLKIRECRKKIDHSDDIFIIVEMQQMISFFAGMLHIIMIYVD